MTKISLGIGAVFKNESHILKEWINHYLYHGVDRIYLINDHSSDDYYRIRDQYINDKRVVFIDSDVEIRLYRQVTIYEKYLSKVMKDFTWFALLDLDEFLYCPSNVNLKDLLLNYSGVSQLLVKWKSFGSNGHLTQPASVVENFTKRTADIDGEHPWVSHKSIFRPNKIELLIIHAHVVSGVTIGTDDYFINHYIIQSWDYFSQIKMTRGDVNNILDIDGRLHRNEQFFKLYDTNDIHDDELYQQNKLMDP